MTEHEGQELDDGFAQRLEQLDQQLAGETPSVGAHSKTPTDSTDFDAAKHLLGLINRVRSMESEVDAVADPATSVSSANQPDLSAPSFPNQIGSFEILGQIARGGMGVVFRARDRSLNRDVALKMMLAGPFAYAEERSRFRVEAEAAAVLDHPGIVPVFEVGEHEGLPFFTMGLIEGESLAERIAQQPMTPKVAAKITQQVSSAVSYAHKQGVVHRDIKPANILLDNDDRPRITDFGLARRRDTESDLTATQQVLGTPNYMAPEQASGAASAADERTDVYSIGATLYCMLTGRPPFQGHNAAETVRLVLDRDPVAPRQLNPGIPIDLNTICLKCLQKDPERRYRDAESLESDLNRFLNGVPIQARPVGILETVWKWACRHPSVAALASCCLLAVVALVGGGIWYQTRLNRSLIDLQESRQQIVRSLYRAFTNEAEYLGQMRPIGYGQRIEQLVAKAKSLDTDAKEVDQLRQLLVNGLGHVGGETPVVMDPLQASITAAEVWRDRNQLIVGLEDGTLTVFDLASQTRVFENQAMSTPIVRIDVNVTLGDGTTRYLRTVGKGGTRIHHWSWDGHSYIQDETLNPRSLPKDFLGIEVSPNGRHVIGLESAPGQLHASNVWHTRSTPDLKTDPDRRMAGLKDMRFAIASIDPTGEYSIRRSTIPVSRRFDVNNDFLVLGKSWLDEETIDDDLKIYDFHSGQLVQSINASVGALQNVRLSSDGRFVACGGYFGVEVFRLSNGDKIAKHTELGRCTVVSFIGNDGDVLVRTEEETVWLSAQHSGPVLQHAHDDSASVRVSSDGKSLVWIGDRRPRVSSLQGNQRLRINAHSLIVETVCMSPDGQLLLSTGRYYGGNETKVWKVDSGELAFEFIGSASTFSPDGSLIAAWNGRVQVWDVETGQIVAEGDCKQTPSRILFSESGETLLAVGNFSGHSRAWQLHRSSTNEQVTDSGLNDGLDLWQLHPIELHSDVRKPASLSPSGHRIAFASQEGLVVSQVSDPRKVKRMKTERPANPDSLVFLDDDRLLFVDGEAHVWNLSTNDIVRTKGRDLEPPVLLSHDKERLICRRQLLLSDGFQSIFRLPDWNNAITTATCNQDGHWLAYGLDGGDIEIWNLASVQEKLVEHGFPCAVVSPNSPNAIESVSKMLQNGQRQGNRIHPDQWRYDCNRLTQWIQQDLIDSNRIYRNVRILAEQLDRLDGRPFFDANQYAVEHILDSAFALNNELSRIEHLDGQRMLLSALSHELRREPPDSIERAVQGSSAHHLLGDLLIFQFADPLGAIDAYVEESELLKNAGALPAKSEYAGIWFWLYRNNSRAFARDERWEEAIESMTRALQIHAEHEQLLVDEKMIAQDQASLESWRKQLR